jgi:hypothetical protein
VKRLDQKWSVQKDGCRDGVARLCADNGASYEMDAHRARRIAKAINAEIDARIARNSKRKRRPEWQSRKK